MATAIRMVETDAVRALARAGRGELAVMVLTGAVTLVVDLVVAVAVGLALAGALALRRVAGTARVEHLPFEAAQRWPRRLRQPVTPAGDSLMLAVVRGPRPARQRGRVEGQLSERTTARPVTDRGTIRIQ
ncbi:hypothetical protein [Parafrankia elaeagni]|uniref:hypothetical protein n=1 Tax=Parafrankia elaeagni TaxID=222534 RepID=UPI00037B0417|nr:hypothetical protein [Parafrankia elaeagni]